MDYRGKSFDFNLTTQQQQIIDWVLDGDQRAAVVAAVPGSGKTTTAVAVSQYLPPGSLFVAFNKKIVTELQERLPAHVTASTLHSAGLKVLTSSEVGRFLRGKFVQDGKYKTKLYEVRDACREAGKASGRGNAAVFGLNTTHAQREWFIKNIHDFSDFFDMARMNLVDVTDASALASLAAHYEYSLHSTAMFWYEGLIERLMAWGAGLEHRRCVDFADMTWLPTYLDLDAPPRPWIVVDEAQDLNPAQLELVMRLSGSSGRMLFVGDPRQAIYGFAGAGSTSIQDIVDRLNAKTLPLSTTYRCPKSVVRLANHLIGDTGANAMTAWERADEGVIRLQEYKSLYQDVTHRDLVLSRVTAPLVLTCLHLISQRVPARVEGREIGKGLEKAVSSVSGIPGYTDAKFLHFVDIWSQAQAQYLLDKIRNPNSPSIQAVYDKAECLRIIWNQGCRSANDCLAQIRTIFSDPGKAVTLSTIHRAKGLEYDRVYWLNPWRVMRGSGWQLQQERNLLYVAATRAKKELVLVDAGDKPDRALVSVMTGYVTTGPRSVETIDDLESAIDDLAADLAVGRLISEADLDTSPIGPFTEDFLLAAGADKHHGSTIRDPEP